MKTDKKIVIEFADVREDILAALNKRPIKIGEPTTLLEGFVSGPFREQLTNSFIIGGPTIPMIMLFGNESGQIYLFALRALLPDIGI